MIGLSDSIQGSVFGPLAPSQAQKQNARDNLGWSVGTLGYVHAAQFDVVPDQGPGVDMGPLLQKAIDYAAGKRLELLISPGVYYSSINLKGPFRYGYQISGMGARVTEIRCSGTNIPVLSLGDRIQGTNAAPGAAYVLDDGTVVDNDSNCVGWAVRGLKLSYVTTQTRLETAGNCLVFAGPFTDAGAGWVQLSDGVVEDMIFNGGHYGIWTDPTKGWMPWGSIFYRLQFGTMRAGFVYMNGTGVGGPNNHFYLLYGRGDLCVSNSTLVGGFEVAPALFVLKGYACSVTGYEVNWNGHTAAGSGSMAIAGTTLTGGPFVAADVGRAIAVRTAGAAGATLYTTIATYISPTQVTLTAANASGNVITAQGYFFGGPSEFQNLAGSDVTLGQFKSENFIKLNGQNFISMLANSKLSVDQATTGGSGEQEVNGAVYVVSTYGGGQSKGLTVNRLTAINPLSGGGTLYCFNGQSGSGRIHVTGQLDLGTTVLLTNAGSNTAADSVVVDGYNNGLLSADKRGSGTYTFTLGDPTHVIYDSALTALENFVLETNPNKVPNGLTIMVSRTAAATGAFNVAFVVAAGTVNLTAAGQWSMLQYRRVAAGNGWKVIAGTGL